MGDYVKSTYVKNRGALAALLAGVSKEALAEAMKPRVGEDLPQTCGECDSRRIVTREITHYFPYGVGEAAVTLSARIPVRKCENCGNEWSDHHAEEIMLMDQDMKDICKGIFIVFCLFAFTCGVENTITFIAALGPVAATVLAGIVWLLYKLMASIKASTAAREERRRSRLASKPKNPYRNPDLR